MNIISSSNSWHEFETKLRNLSKKEKGNAFEELTRLYLLTNPLYLSLLDKVWHHSKVPQDVKDKLDLPETEIGIDLVCKTKEGQYWAVQCKYHQDSNVNLNLKELSTFFSETEKRISENKFSYRIVVSSAQNIGIKLKKRNSMNIGYLLYDILSLLDADDFSNFRKVLNKETISIKPYKPRDHQNIAIKNCISYFKNKDNTRGKIIHPCASGKSLTGYWCANSLNAKTILIAVPSIALVRQTLLTWVREAISNHIKMDWITVCSDEEVSSTKDELAMRQEDLDIEVTTNLDDISNFLKNSNADSTVLITTYQSSKVVSAGVKKANISFDLGIFDEAHKTVGQQDKPFAHLLHDENVSMQRRIFMTATEKQYIGNSNDVISMDDENIYGNVIDELSFKSALDQKPPILCDYKIVTTVILQSEIDNLIRMNIGVKPDGHVWENTTDASTFASLIVLRKLIKENEIKRIISFHRSIKRANEFAQLNLNAEKVDNTLRKLDIFHLNGKDGSGKRTATFNRFKSSDSSLITNARCLTEGVDIPAIDAILFADPKQSKIDIVQATGRALRPFDGKKYSYIIIPVVVDENDENTSDKAFDQIISVVSALGANDERIIEEFKDIFKGRKSNENIFTINDLPQSIKIKYSDFVSNIELKIWNRLNSGWSEGFKYLQNYFNREGHSNAPRNFNVDGFQLGTWVRTQRSFNKKNKLSEDRINKLNSLNFLFNPFDDKWDFGFKHLQDFFNREGHSNVPSKYKVDGYELGEWARKQRQYAHNDKFSKDKLNKLKALNFLFDPKEERWSFGFKHLQDFFNRKGHCNVPYNYKVDEYNLYHWISNIRKRFKDNKLSKNKVEQLNSLNFIYDPFEDQWNLGFQHLQNYFNQEGHSNVKSNFEVDRFKLGSWVRTNRDNNKLSKEKIKKLQSVNFLFNFREEQWNKGFKYLQEYFNREGHSNAPKSIKVDGYALGTWVRDQRISIKTSKLSKAKIKKLMTVNFSINPIEDQWNLGFKHLQGYFNREGHSNVPDSFKVDGYNLGTWVRTQITVIKKNKISKDRINKLKTVNFLIDPKEERWNFGFKHLQDFFNQEGHCNVKSNFEVDGFQLGEWVRRQRRFAHNDKLSKEKLDKLKTIKFKV